MLQGRRMPEGFNIEIAHKLAEYEAGATTAARFDLLEIAEAVMLALIAVATAWSGYHAAKWDGHQALLYGHASTLRVEAGVAAIEGAQQRLLDVVQSNEWIRARDAKNQQLADAYRDRLSAEYRVAFDAWLKTEPLTNPDAPSGPTAMPEYRNALLEKAAELNNEGHGSVHRGDKSASDRGELCPQHGAARHRAVPGRRGAAVQNPECATGFAPRRRHPDDLCTRRCGDVPAAVRRAVSIHVSRAHCSA